MNPVTLTCSYGDGGPKTFTDILELLQHIGSEPLRWKKLPDSDNHFINGWHTVSWRGSFGHLITTNGPMDEIRRYADANKDRMRIGTVIRESHGTTIEMSYNIKHYRAEQERLKRESSSKT
jgi:hypothetical protein